MINKIRLLALYFRTIQHLRVRQIFYQLLYRLKRIAKAKPIAGTKPKRTLPLVLRPSIPTRKTFLNRRFLFINKEKFFEGEIDWNFERYGKLWTYNLNYFDFLHQPDINKESAISLLNSYCVQSPLLMTGVEPYPIAIRGVNWIKFFSYKRVFDPTYDNLLYKHYRFLSNNLEYHLMGNHLLENGFSLLFAAYYFDEKIFYDKARKILETELREQILQDGGHFELSPMYHQILLFRLLDCINLMKNNPRNANSLLPICLSYASRMVGWLKAITFHNGDIPLIGDSARNIAPTSRELIAYAESLGITAQAAALRDSGYRMMRSTQYELLVDVGNIGPDYIPGHAHCDTFSFVLYQNGQPVIVDTGTSTYESGGKRILERSTASHNTVMLADVEQSEVWGSFRVGRRAKVVRLDEQPGEIRAWHNGYRSIGAMHSRCWIYSDQSIRIMDEITAEREYHCKAFLHFHPTINPVLQNSVLLIDSLQIEFENADTLELAYYDYSEEFNQSQRASMIVISFRQKLETRIFLQSEATALDR